MSQLQSLSCDAHPGPVRIHAIPSLTVLTLTDCTYLTRIGPVATCNTLVTLRMTKCQLLLDLNALDPARL